MLAIRTKKLFKVKIASNLSKAVRKKIIQLAYSKRASHVGGALSVADILSVLYSNILNYYPDSPKDSRRDRLFYSKGHACLALYATLCESGFFDEQDLDTFTSDGSDFTSHVSSKVPGIELSTGSLGHALNVACGVAMAGKLKNADWHVYVILSDGELNEGSNWEAILFASHHKLSNLTIIVDYNKIQSFGFVKDVMKLEPLKEKLETFGMHVLEVDGHDHKALTHAFRECKNSEEAPSFIIAHTIKGKGVDFMENDLAWHYKSPNNEQLIDALHQIDLNCP